VSPAEKRRVAVQGLIDGRFGGRVIDFARAIERSPAQVWQFMNQRNIGERLARQIEAKLDLRRGELDGEEATFPGVAGDERELLESYRQSLPRWKRMLRQIAGVKPSDQQEELCEALHILISHLSTRNESARTPGRLPERYAMPRFLRKDADEPPRKPVTVRRKRSSKV
jgi:hypothetical protein